MTKWLSKDQQVHWRSWITASSVLPELLSRELQEEFGLTITDYEILVRLSEAPNRQVRMSELAQKTLLSRSRLSHQVDRLEDRGLVTRRTCEDDRRGQHCAMTNKGWDTLVAAAPLHVSGVRRHFVDQLTDSEYEALGKALGKIAAHLDEELENS
jgi:DNA-binding MarR family transcriptional regulator